MKNWRYAIQYFVFRGKTASATHFHGFLPIKWKSAIIATLFFHTRKTLFMASDTPLSLLCSQITWWCLYIIQTKHNATQKYLPMPSHWEVEKSKRLPGDVFDAAIRARSLKVAASGSKAVGQRHNTLGACSGLWKTWLETWDEINFSASIST